MRHYSVSGARWKQYLPPRDREYELALLLIFAIVAILAIAVFLEFRTQRELSLHIATIRDLNARQTDQSKQLAALSRQAAVARTQLTDALSAEVRQVSATLGAVRRTTNSRRLRERTTDAEFVASLAQATTEAAQLHEELREIQNDALQNQLLLKNSEAGLAAAATGSTLQSEAMAELGEQVAITRQESLIAPVYNAIYSSPLVEGSVRLAADKPTTLRFYIGSPSMLNALGSAESMVNPKLLKATKDTSLDVAFMCRLCMDGGFQIQSIKFSENTLVSSEANFTFTPGDQMITSTPSAQVHMGAQDNPSRQPSATIIVQGGGVIYDQIPLVFSVYRSTDVSIATRAPSSNEPHDSAPALATSGAPPPKISIIKTVAPPSDHAESLRAYTPPDRRSRPADLIIKIERDNDDLKVNMSAGSVRLQRRLGALYNQANQDKFFTIRGFTAGQLDEQSRTAAIVIQAVIDAKNEALRKAAKHANIAPVSDTESIADLHLSIADRDRLLQALYDSGRSVYKQLFSSQQGDLAQIISTVEAFSRELPQSSDPVRILIQTGNIPFPWQLLHSDQGSFPNDLWSSRMDFWGYRYELAVDYVERQSAGRLDSFHVTSASKPISVFAIYHGPSSAISAASVESYGMLQWKYLKNAIPVDGGEPLDTKETLLKSLITHKSGLEYLLVYAHGSNGWVAQRVGGVDGLIPEVDGLRVILRDDNYFIPSDIDTLSDGPSTNGPILSNMPIVILKACNTGTLSVLQNYIGKTTFPKAFLDIGASGIVATEVPMWDEFAYAFGNELIDRMASGKPLSLALLEARRKYGSSPYFNPLGLLYSYYGGATVDIEKK